MTEQKAIEILESNTERRSATQYVQIKKIAIEALKKQVPKKLLNYNKISAAGNCPECMTFVDSYDAYCRNCGKRLEEEQ